MTSALVEELVPSRVPAVRGHETRRGQWGMLLFIGTEATLFALLFFAYFYLGSTQPRWPPAERPSYWLALVLLAILAASSATAHWGQRGIERGSGARLGAGLALTLLLGVAFLAVQYVEYGEQLKRFTPTGSAYGSAFFTITSFHMAHLVLGWLMLAFVLARLAAGHFSRERHLAVKNAILYWHFVDVVWVGVVAVLYLSPQLFRVVP